MYFLTYIMKIYLMINNYIDELTSLLARKFHLKSKDLKAIFEDFTPFDSLCINNTRDIKYRLRKNIYDTHTI